MSRRGRVELLAVEIGLLTLADLVLAFSLGLWGLALGAALGLIPLAREGLRSRLGA